MYILVVGNNYPTNSNPMSGLFPYDQAKALKKIGFDVVYVALDLRSIRRYRKFGVIQVYKDGIKIYKLSLPVGAINKKIFYKLSKIFFNFILRKVCKDNGIPQIIHSHFIDISISVSYGAKKKNIPYVVTEHSSIMNQNKIDKVIYNLAMDTYKNSEDIITVSQSIRRSILNKFNMDSIIVPNMYDSELFFYTDKSYFERERDSDFIFVSTGNLIHAKGFSTLLKSFAIHCKSYKKSRLIIIGDGPLSGELKKLTEQLNLNKNVEFKGLRNRHEIADIYKKSDFFVLLSQGETFGVSYIEAMACGLPVLATKCGGPEEFVNEHNGILVGIDNVDQTVKAMKKMCEDYDYYNREHIALNVEKKYSPDVVANQISHIYKKIIDNKGINL